MTLIKHGLTFSFINDLIYLCDNKHHSCLVFFLQLANKYEKVYKRRVHEYTEKMHQFMYKRTKQTHKSQVFQTTGSEEAANSV